MKFSTPMGALSGNSVQVRLPTLVSMMAVGLPVAAWCTVGLAVAPDLAAGALWEFDWALTVSETVRSKTGITKALRMIAPGICTRAKFLELPRCIVRQHWSSMRLCLHLAADVFDLAKNAQQIAPQDLLDVIGGVSAAEKGLRNLRQVGGGVQTLRRGATDAVEVRAQANVVHPGNLGDVIDVVD